MPRLLLGLVAVAAVGLVAVATLRAPSSPAAAATSGATTATARVVRTDLVDQQSFTGTLGYGATSRLVNHLSGTVTWEAAAGATVDRGQVLYRIDAKPVFLMFGGTPVYRDLVAGIADGDDVKELQENLLALGYATGSNLVADGHFDGYTTAAVERWQHAQGLTVDGRMPLGLVVFELGAVRTASWHSGVGEQAGPGPIADITSTSHVVTLNLDARRQTLATVGAAVSVTLPSGQAAPGHISEVGTVATPASSGSAATIPVTITLDDAKAGGSVDQAPVTVALAGQSAKGVLAVPINALLARAEGGYAVEVIRDGRHQVVPVTTGLFAQGKVQVSGSGLAEGDLVVVPAQ